VGAAVFYHQDRFFPMVYGISSPVVLEHNADGSDTVFRLFSGHPSMYTLKVSPAALFRLKRDCLSRGLGGLADTPSSEGELVPPETGAH
jgi:hypothetical protein